MAGEKGLNVTTIEQILGPAIQEKGCELIFVELGRAGSRQILRLYIDKPGGVSIDDCERISREVEPILDAEDFFSGRYLLEVSSPGLDRPLRRAEDFARFLGQQARVELKAPLEGRRRVTGQIEAVEGEKITLLLEGGQRLSVALSSLKKANLVWDGTSPPKAP